MRITITKKELQNKLNAVGKIIQPNKAFPALENFQFEMNSGILQVAGSDESGWIKSSIDHNSEIDDILFTVNAKTLLDGLKEIPEQPITIVLKDEDRHFNLTVEYASGSFLMTAGKERIIDTSFEYEEKAHVAACAKFINGIKLTQFRSASDELRQVLCGVFVEKINEDLTFVATDGNTLALMEYKNLIKNNTDNLSVIFPKKLCKTMTDVITDGDLRYSVSGNRILVSHPDFTLCYRMIEGRFPNYRAVIPDSFSHEAIFNKQMIVSLLKRITVFANSGYNDITLEFSSGKLDVSTSNNMYATSAYETMPIDYSGSGLKICFNGSFLLNLISNMKGNEIKIQMINETKPAVLTDNNSTNEEELQKYIIMPLRLNN